MDVGDGSGQDSDSSMLLLLFFLNNIYTTVGQASDSMAALALSFNPLAGACRLSLAGPTEAKLEVFSSSDYLLLCFIIVC